MARPKGIKSIKHIVSSGRRADGEVVLFSDEHGNSMEQDANFSCETDVKDDLSLWWAAPVFIRTSDFFCGHRYTMWRTL